MSKIELHKGDWCWFWNEGCTDYATIAEFNHISYPMDTDVNRIQYYSKLGENYNMWDYCEAFAGKLPTHLRIIDEK